jgi:hypothetical protein
MKLSRNLTYAVAEYYPRILLSLELLDRHHHEFIFRDVSYLHTLLEEVYGYTNTR